MMNQRYQQNQPITSYATTAPITNMVLRSTNYPNVIVQRQQFQSSVNYPEMQTSQPIYEGIDPNIVTYNPQNSKQNYNGLQYSNVTDIDPNFFTGNEYDNAVAPPSRTASMSVRPINMYKPPYINGTNSRVSTMSSQPDRSISFKSTSSTTLPTIAIPTNSTKFENIRKTCFATKTLFVDPDFPPSDSSLYRTRRPNFPITWMRPPEIINLFNQKNGTNLRPEFIVNGYELCDLNQGGLGDCWVVAAFAAITCHDFERNNFLARVIPPGQNFRPGWYTGAFLFRFWRNGEWREVVIDDILPTKEGQLVYVSSIAPNEFWGALVEKAYAKLNGCYEALDAGQLADALDDFTGGMTECYSLDTITSAMSINNVLPSDFDDQLIKAFERHSLITAGIFNKQSAGSVKTATGVIMPNGLVAGHAYTISDIRRIKLTDGNLQQTIVTLIRVRNPWGNEIEWKGAWSDYSSEWNSISENDRKVVGLVKKADGEFWISMKDFLVNFDTLDICHVPSRGLQSKHVWHCSSVFGEWKTGVSAGGRPKLVNTHYMNPNYRLDITESQDNVKCNVLIGLLQEDVRGADPTIAALGNLSIGFVIYQLKPNNPQTSINASFFKTNSYIASVDSFIDAREVVKRFQLPLGSYIIVPSTYDCNQDRKFLLRIFLESPNNCLHTHDNVSPSVQSDLKSEPSKDTFYRQMFYRESGNDRALTAFQLQRLLNCLLMEKGFKYDVSVEACKAMVQLFDKNTTKADLAYKLHEDQFMNLWAWLLKCFKQIQAAEKIGPVALKSALDSMQLQVSNQNFQNIIHRFCNESGFVSVSSFLTIVALLSKANETFTNFQKNNLISQTHEEFLNNITRI